MNETKRNYNKKCKQRLITFYLHEQKLYDFSKKLNFQKFTKEQLKKKMKEYEAKKGI